MENNRIKIKNKPKIYEDQTLLEQFSEPELMRFIKVYKAYLEQKTLAKTINTLCP
jgi:hypothetical protein